MAETNPLLADVRKLRVEVDELQERAQANNAEMLALALKAPQGSKLRLIGELQVARHRLTRAEEALREIESENRKRSWFFGKVFRDVALATWTADRAASYFVTERGATPDDEDE